MISKTPNFDKTLDEILENLKPHQKKCQQCQEIFNIFKEDIEFYKMLRVPEPKLCPECRKQRRFGFYNNILKFYKKEDALTKEKIISTFSPDSPYKIYDLKYWWSDKWGAEDYKRNYPDGKAIEDPRRSRDDFNKSFFEQFQKLNLTIPHPAITHYWKGMINSPYTISVGGAKDCYLISSAGINLENVHYSYWIGFAKDCLDCLGANKSENCYELINCLGCYNCKFCEYCFRCIDSIFLYNCRDCQNCFGCANLKHKSYCFFNEQLSKEEYNKKIKEINPHTLLASTLNQDVRINLGDRKVLEKYRKKFEEILKKTIRKNLQNDIKNINCFGDRVSGGKNCYQIFRSFRDIENLRYCTDVVVTKDSMDIWLAGPHIEISYELVEVIYSSNVKFSYFINNGLELEYCLECHNCQSCFGCIGLRNKSYYIFNKEYSKEEYYELLDKIKTKMLSDGEYGEFFSLSMSLHPYNDTYAMIEFPLTKEKVLKNGWQWQDESKISPDLMELELIETKDIPKDIKDVDDSILDKAIICEITGKPFRIIQPELEFYRKHNLPIPTKHPFQRILERFQKRNPSKLFKAICSKCGNQMWTSYPPEKQKELKIYCESCYIQEVI